MNEVSKDQSPDAPIWQRALVVVYVLAMVAEVVLWHARLRADFLPFDRSFIGPNVVAGIVVVEVMTPIGVLLYPPVRRCIEEWVRKRDEEIKAHVTAEHAKLHKRLSAIEESHKEIHRKLDSIQSS
jgi:hypothetical protein